MPLWTKTPFALVLWIGWALVAQCFVCGAFFWGSAKGSPSAGQYLFEVKGPGDPIALPWVWWTSYVSLRLAAVGLALVIVGYMAGALARRYAYRWYLDSKDYVFLHRAIATVAIVYAVLVMVGMSVNVFVFGWQLTSEWPPK